MLPQANSFKQNIHVPRNNNPQQGHRNWVPNPEKWTSHYFCCRVSPLKATPRRGGRSELRQERRLHRGPGLLPSSPWRGLSQIRKLPWASDQGRSSIKTPTECLLLKLGGQVCPFGWVFLLVSRSKQGILRGVSFGSRTSLACEFGFWDHLLSPTGFFLCFPSGVPSKRGPPPKQQTHRMPLSSPSWTSSLSSA